MHREKYEDRTIGCCLIFFSTIRQLLCKNVRNTEELEICKKIIQEIKEFIRSRIFFVAIAVWKFEFFIKQL